MLRLAAATAAARKTGPRIGASFVWPRFWQSASERSMKRMNRLARARPAQARKASATPESEERTLDVAEIGGRGDGLAAGENGPIYVPYALPGEQVRARVAADRATVLEVLNPSTERREPACRHFGRCGGCQLQHWDEAPYLDWKRERVVDALEKRGMHFAVAPTIAA